MSATLAVWAWRAETQAQQVAHEAMDERDRARQAQERAEHQRDEAAKVRQETARERDAALLAEKATREAYQGAKTVVAFLEDRLLSAGRPKAFNNPYDKAVTLCQALDMAARDLASTFFHLTVS